MVIAFTNARVVDPASGRDAIGSVVVRDRVIESIDGSYPADTRVIDCGGRIVAPGLIDAGVFAADACVKIADRY